VTEWFDRHPGQQVMTGEPDLDGSVMMLIMDPDSPPDWVVGSSGLGLDSGRRLRVIDHHLSPCPKCKMPRSCLHLILADTELRVCECLQCGFVWYRMREGEGEQDGT